MNYNAKDIDLLLRDLKAARALLIESEKATELANERQLFFDKILASSLCGIYIYDVTSGHNEFINSQYTKITGWSLGELNAMTSDQFSELFHPEERMQVLSHMQEVIESRANEAIEIEYRFKTKSGNWIWCLSRDIAFDRGENGSVLKFIGTFLDISLRKSKEEEKRLLAKKLQQTEYLESLGVLAGGFAHDFNNILMTIMGYAELTINELPSNSNAIKNLENITNASKHAASLCTQLLAYAGKIQGVTAEIFLSEIVEQNKDLLESNVSKAHHIEFVLDPSLPAILGDQSQLLQIIANFIKNASEALDNNDGVICISTGQTFCSAERLEKSQINIPLSAGDYVYVKVSDNGIGMEHEILNRIFEPFFTTKFIGRGLGLSAVLGIVLSHKGALFVESTVGEGSTFEVLFPIINPQTKDDLKLS